MSDGIFPVVLELLIHPRLMKKDAKYQVSHHGLRPRCPLQLESATSPQGLLRLTGPVLNLPTTFSSPHIRKESETWEGSWALRGERLFSPFPVWKGEGAPRLLEAKGRRKSKAM